MGAVGGAVGDARAGCRAKIGGSCMERAHREIRMRRGQGVAADDAGRTGAQRMGGVRVTADVLQQAPHAEIAKQFGRVVRIRHPVRKGRSRHGKARKEQRNETGAGKETANHAPVLGAWLGRVQSGCAAAWLCRKRQ